jgi:hypothetical protein
VTDCVVVAPESLTRETEGVLCVVKWCTVAGLHLDYEDHPEDCAGCLPALAEHGLTCHQDSRRLRDHLGEREGIRPHRRECEAPRGQDCECPDPPHGLAWAWDHLTAAHPLVASPAPSDGSTGKRAISDPEAERLAAVLALRDEIRDVLGSWAATVAERIGGAGPLGVTVHTNPQHERHVGPDRVIVRNCQTWLLRNIASVEGHESVRELSEELAGLMSRAHALAPWRPAPTHLDGIPCRCGACALHDHGDEVKCWACGLSYTPEHYETLCKVLAYRVSRGEEERSA